MSRIKIFLIIILIVGLGALSFLGLSYWKKGEDRIQRYCVSVMNYETNRLSIENELKNHPSLRYKYVEPSKRVMMVDTSINFGKLQCMLIFDEKGKLVSNEYRYFQ